MKQITLLPVSLILCSVAAALLVACGGDGGATSPPPTSSYAATVLASDGSASAPNTNPDLKNGWGVAFSASSTAWLSSNGTQRSLLFDGDGVPQSLVVAVPAGVNGPAGPTGMIFNSGSTTDFVVSAQGKSSKATFLFATDAGTIAGWSPNVLPTDAVTAFDDGAGAANYKGLTLVPRSDGNFLYAADFHNNKVDIFNSAFAKQAPVAGAFADPTIPQGFAPFGIQSVGNAVVVTYAKQDAAARVQVKGAGFGYVDIFDTAGNLVSRLTGNGFNAPWGVALAPTDFGPHSNALLIGNFGDGTIDVFASASLSYLGKLTLGDGSTFAQAGLWGMRFGNDAHDQPHNTLFYAAGPHGKADGVFGRLDVVAN